MVLALGGSLVTQAVSHLSRVSVAFMARVQLVSSPPATNEASATVPSEAEMWYGRHSELLFCFSTCAHNSCGKQPKTAITVSNTVH